MKIRCIEKKRHATTDSAKEHIKRVYLERGILLSVYECPVCLDFHVTHKCDNRILRGTKLKAEFRKEALRSWMPHWSRKSTANTIRDRMNAMYTHLGLKKPKLKKITGTKRENTLPLARQREILQAIGNSVLM